MTKAHISRLTAEMRFLRSVEGKTESIRNKKNRKDLKINTNISKVN
jgi:hypothetical protein